MGFTIIELLIVIVVIGILTAITIVAYNGIARRAVGASLQSDLKGAKTQLALYNVENGKYPDTNDCNGAATPMPPKICLKASSGNTFGSSYVPNNTVFPPTYTLQAAHDDLTYAVTESTSPVLVANAGITCPTGFIIVPGSGTYGTSDFCVMKYEASNSGGVAVSQPGDLPWVNISQATSISTSAAVCNGCHLITEPEWLTIAQNVLSVPSNWTSGTVGVGYIYSGHNDNYPGRAIATDSNDANGYIGTANYVGSNQRRTLTLTNGEVIWDLSGNVWEWTSGTSTTGQPGSSGYAWREWNTPLATSGAFPTAMPAYGTPAAVGWNSSTGIGRIYSNSDETALRVFLCSGYFYDSSTSGVLTLVLYYTPSYSDSYNGFRVAK